jgi:peptidoglycan/LPS O-acetylase OafA/YrhL
VTHAKTAEAHLDCLDGFRGLAALMVVLDHFAKDINWFGGIFQFLGALGVMCFFGLSGFLMMHVTEGVEPSRENVRIFWIRRVSRVVPLFVIVLTVGFLYQLLFSGWLQVPEQYLAYNTIKSWDVYLLNLIFVRGDEVFWTISVELLFYLIFPLLWIARYNSPKALLLMLVGWFAVQIILSLVSDLAFNHRMDFFLVGVMAQMLYRQVWTRSRGVWNAAFGVVSALFVVSLPQLAALMGLPIWGQAWSSGWLLVLVFLLLIAMPNSSLAGYVLGHRVAVFVGMISYSIYLWHRFVVRFFAAWVDGHDGLAVGVFFLVVLPLVLAVAWLSYRYIERPAREAIHRRYLFRGPASAQSAAGLRSAGQ